MNNPSTVSVTTETLRVADASLYHEVRGQGSLVVLVGAPMDAASFAPLADRLAAGHTVLTTDPRGIGRSQVDDLDQDSTPQVRADDLARLITHVDAGPATVLGSSGGAVSALAFMQARPELVHTVIAHEPPLLELLDERERQREQTDDIIATYHAGDVVGAWRKFLDNANIVMPEEVFQYMFGGERDEQRAADERHWFEHELRPTVDFVPDIAALRSSATRIVVGIGDDSTGQICDRTSAALAAELGIAPTMFPGGHTGFADDPEAFDIRLREVLDGR